MSISKYCRGELWVFLSVVFGDRWRNMSRSPMCHKMEIFFKQNFEKIGENETIPLARKRKKLKYNTAGCVVVV